MLHVYASCRFYKVFFYSFQLPSAPPDPSGKKEEIKKMSCMLHVYASCDFFFQLPSAPPDFPRKKKKGN